MQPLLRSLVAACVGAVLFFGPLGAAAAPRVIPMDPNDLETSAGASYSNHGVAVFDVTGQPNLKVVSYMKFAVDLGSGIQFLTWDQADVQLSDPQSAQAVEIAIVVSASYIAPSDPILSNYPPDSEYLQHYESGQYLMLIVAGEDPPIVKRPCPCCTPGACTWGCLKDCYR